MTQFFIRNFSYSLKKKHRKSQKNPKTFLILKTQTKFFSSIWEKGSNFTIFTMKNPIFKFYSKSYQNNEKEMFFLKGFLRLFSSVFKEIWTENNVKSLIFFLFFPLKKLKILKKIQEKLKKCLDRLERHLKGTKGHLKKC